MHGDGAEALHTDPQEAAREKDIVPGGDFSNLKVHPQ